jgi:hypothetical protein
MGKYVAGCAIAAATAFWGGIAGIVIGSAIGARLDAQDAARGIPPDPNNTKLGEMVYGLYAGLLGAILTPAVTLTVIAFLMSRAEERERERKWLEEHESRRRRSQPPPSAPPGEDFWN